MAQMWLEPLPCNVANAIKSNFNCDYIHAINHEMAQQGRWEFKGVDCDTP